MNNKSLHDSKRNKNDEFYTRYEDIEDELSHYVKHFKNKIIYCNCDNPEYSNFYKYFIDNFKTLELKKLIATYYDNKEKPLKAEYDGKFRIAITDLNEDGDFRNQECVDILKEADIIVTNPPFSLFREYIAQLIKYNKNFIIVGNDNAVTYREIFPLIKDNKIWKGITHPREFIQPDGSTKKFGNISWFTNIDIDKRHNFIQLTKHYFPEKYPKFDNYDAINVDKISDIPMDYYGVMGVPITFLDKYNPEQFEIIGLGISKLGLSIGVKPYKENHKKYRKEIQKRGTADGDLYMIDKNNHPIVPYARIAIKRKE